MKKLIIIVLILFLLVSSALVYLNKFYLPVKIKSAVISALIRQTGKDVSLESLEFSIFKGLVLRGLVVSDGQTVILSAREASCGIIVWPVFRKQIIIPSVNLKSPYIFLQRLKDGSLNLQNIFASRPPVVELPDSSRPEAKKSEFQVSVYKVNISSGNILFQDDTLNPPFRKQVKNIQFRLGLALPVSVKFNFKGEIPGDQPALIYGWGEYRIIEQNLEAGLSLDKLALKDFEPYYISSGINLVSGSSDGTAKLSLKEKNLHLELSVKAGNLVFAKEKAKVSLNLELKGKVDYNLGTKKTVFSGSCDIRQADISGLDFLGEVKNLHGKVVFNERSLSAESLKMDLLGIPLEAKLGVNDFKTPVLSINTILDLSLLVPLAKEKFNFTQVSSAYGAADLFVKVSQDAGGAWEARGKVGISAGGFKLSKQENPFENISASVEFSRDSLSWKDTKFRYQGADYQSAGELRNFSAPDVKLQLSSPDLFFSGAFSVSGKTVKITQLKGRYFNSQFSAGGIIDNSNPAFPLADIIGDVSLEIGDLGRIIYRDKPSALDSMKLKGVLDIKFILNGPVNDFKNCSIQARSSSSRISLYGLNTGDFLLDYLQEGKIARIVSMRAVFYEGLIEVSASLNLDSANLPYHAELQAQGIRLEKLKMDTASKTKNFSGLLQAQVKLNGFSGDLNKLSGAGSFSVKDGRLWELNLLRGVGKLLFAKDLASIELSQCSCSFLVQNNAVSTDNLKLSGNVAELSGPLKIGFNGSLEGALEVSIVSEMVPLSGSLKDVTTAFMGKVGKFGVIRLSGTLSEPKYNFKPVVTNIIKGITDVLFGRNP